jgi:hypothetical protein
MHDADSMKGTGTPLIVIVRQDLLLTLYSYPDGSTGISRNGKYIGVWEPHERDDCFRVFARHLCVGIGGGKAISVGRVLTGNRTAELN